LDCEHLLRATPLTRRFIAQFAAQRTANQVAEQRLSVLTECEREVLTLVGQGMSNDEIGAELYAMAKRGARDRAQLVVIAYQTELVTL
jgi:DNA-binding NarL/FixJ family response regulator